MYVVVKRFTGWVLVRLAYVDSNMLIAWRELLPSIKSQLQQHVFANARADNNGPQAPLFTCTCFNSVGVLRALIESQSNLVQAL